MTFRRIAKNAPKPAVAQMGDDLILEKIGMVVHMTSSDKDMAPEEVQEEMLRYYSEYSSDYRAVDCDIDYITVCLILATQLGLGSINWAEKNQL